jgi:ribonuclease HI
MGAEGSEKDDLEIEEQKAATLKALAMHGTFDIEIWTDGSAMQDLGRSGAAYCIYSGERKIGEGKSAAGALACSYTAERIALREALKSLLRTLTIDTDWIGRKIRVLIAPDCQSMLMSLLSGPLAQQDCVLMECWHILLEICKFKHVDVDVIMQHVYSHCGIERNEEVDALAEEASELPQIGVPTALRDAKALIKKHLKGKWSAELLATDSHRVAHFGVKPPPVAEFDKDRRKQVLAARIRTGQSDILGTLVRKIQPLMPMSCRLCSKEDHVVYAKLMADLATAEKGYIKHSTEPRKCPKCDTTLSNKNKCLRHINTVHRLELDTMKIPCPVGNCTEFFYLQEEVDAHCRATHRVIQGERLERCASTRRGEGEVETHLHLLRCNSKEAVHARKDLKVYQIIRKMGEIPTDLLVEYFLRIQDFLCENTNND